LNHGLHLKGESAIIPEMKKQIAISAFIVIFSLLLFEWRGIDLWFQDLFYNFELKRWIVNRDKAVLKFLFYDGMKIVFILFVSALLIALLFFRKKKGICEYKPGLFIVLYSCLAVPLIVGGLKAVTNTPCPRDITRYGGATPYVTVLEKYPETFRQGEKVECYPAGHASGGFALLSLYFLFKRKRNRHIAFVSVFVMSWMIGTYKMMIGDHFLSHTVATMLLAWLVILIITKRVHAYFKGVDP